jgi:hypothetical protein
MPQEEDKMTATPNRLEGKDGGTISRRKCFTLEDVLDRVSRGPPQPELFQFPENPGVAPAILPC